MQLSFEPIIADNTLGELFRNSDTPAWNYLFERTPELRKASISEQIMAVRKDAGAFVDCFGTMTESQREEFITALTADFFEHMVE